MLSFLGKDQQNNLYGIQIRGAYVLLDCKTTGSRILYQLNTVGLTVNDDLTKYGVSPHIRLDNVRPENHEVLTNLIQGGVKWLVVPKGTFDQILTNCIGGF